MVSYRTGTNQSYILISDYSMVTMKIMINDYCFEKTDGNSIKIKLSEKYSSTHINIS